MLTRLTKHSLGGIPVPLFEGGDEDCLFLDVYVPGSAIRDTSAALPVIVWIYGGAFLFGAKDFLEPILPFYDGSGLIHQSGNEAIYVAMNYRLGAYGWLAGTTMEEDGLPNAGLYDQRAAFEWVQSYISLLGGDPDNVTAMGESAGASSIEHHLIAQGGNGLAPLFSKAILQSPAYEYMWDRRGGLETTFEEFATFANCTGEGLACLRAASAETLVTANTALNAASVDGGFAVGPAADGNWVRQLAPLEFVSGNFHKIDSVLVSHTSAESVLFVDGHIQTDAEFTEFVNEIFPTYTQTGGVTAAIEEFYPPVSTNDTYASEVARTEAFVRDSSFTCNTRRIIEAYGDDSVWSMQYSVTPGYHGTDILPTFYDSSISLDSFAEDVAFALVPLFALLSTSYQSYLTSYAITGDPNTNRNKLLFPTIQWNHPDSSGEQVTGVLDVEDTQFASVTDTQNEKTPCDFWVQVAAAVTNLGTSSLPISNPDTDKLSGGYAPPDAVVNQTLVPVTNDPSANYDTP
jgi:carboxylesterase type B